MSGTSERFIGVHTIYGVEGEHETPYMTRAWIGRLRLHIIHRPDADPDCHDHPWDYWTFPLTPYVEEVVCTHPIDGDRWREIDVVPAWRRSFRPAEHCHRIVGRLVNGDEYDPDRKIITIVWRGSVRRKWGFLKNRDGQWCWIAWRDYVFGGGKHAPCEPPEIEAQE